MRGTILWLVGIGLLIFLGCAPKEHPRNIFDIAPSAGYREHITDHLYIAKWKSTRSEFDSFVKKFHMKHDENLLENWPTAFEKNREWWSPKPENCADTYRYERTFVKYQNGMIYLKQEKHTPTRGKVISERWEDL